MDDKSNDLKINTGFIKADKIEAGVIEDWDPRDEGLEDWLREPLVYPVKIADNCIADATIANNIEFPDWFKMYTPEELEVKLAQRRRDNLMEQPWIVRTVVIARVRIWSAILRFFNR